MSLFSSRGIGYLCPSPDRVEGKTVIITGASSGIGKETARELIGRGARVILACRDEAKAQAVALEIAQADPSRVGAVAVRNLDLSSLTSIRQFANDTLQTEPKIDILINNAGVMMCPYSMTEDGFEMQFGVNHLGHFLLTNLLLKRICASAPSRIINVSSKAHKMGKLNLSDPEHKIKKYDPVAAYCQSKLANVLFTLELSKRLKDTGVSVYAVDPGIIRTDLWRHSYVASPVLPWLISQVGGSLMKSAIEGAQTSIYCAVDRNIQHQTGLYYGDCGIKEPSNRARNDVDARKLWNYSKGLVRLEDSETQWD